MNRATKRRNWHLKASAHGDKILFWDAQMREKSVGMSEAKGAPLADHATENQAEPNCALSALLRLLQHRCRFLDDSVLVRPSNLPVLAIAHSACARERRPWRRAPD